jgi:type IV pilus assembly protein PilB
MEEDLQTIDTWKQYQGKIIVEHQQNLGSLLFYRGKGCKQCNNTGYRGRIGIYEILEVTPHISELILQKATETEIKQAALEQNMITMVEDGFIKAKNGITTIEEILRVTKE